MMMMMMMNCFCGMVDWWKAFSLISSRDHCHRSSPSQIYDTPRAGFEPAQNLSSGLAEWSCAVVQYSLFIVYGNGEWYPFVVHIGSPSLISFYLVYFVFSYYFSFFAYFFVSFITCWGIEESWRYLKWSSGVVPRIFSGVSRGDLLQLYLIINVTGLVEPTEQGSVWENN